MIQNYIVATILSKSRIAKTICRIYTSVQLSWSKCTCEVEETIFNETMCLNAEIVTKSSLKNLFARKINFENLHCCAVILVEIRRLWPKKPFSMENLLEC